MDSFRPTASLVQDSQPRNDPLPRTSIGSVTLDQRPVGVTFAILVPIAASQIHTAMPTNRGDKIKGVGRNYTHISRE